MINLKIKTNGTVRNLTLPYPGQSIPDIIEKNSVVTVSEVTEPESLKYMEGHEWNIDEINFLAKLMESFDKREKRQFDAIASQLKPSTGQDLINQTFNLSRYTLISDFSSLTEIGKTHVINRKQAMSFDEMASTDFAKIGKDLIESGKGIPTAYGVMFINEDIPMDIVYDGRHFPEYDYKGSLATVAVICKGETEYLYLPCSIQDINHALTKLPAKTWEECECTLESSNFPAEDWNENSKSILANEAEPVCRCGICTHSCRRIADSAQPVTVTLLVDKTQAELLAFYEKTGSIHFVLEFRGDAAEAQKYLDAQAEYLDKVGGYKGNVTGSDIAYAFHYVGTSDRLYVFEAPIDMMAYISMNKQGWEHHSYTALCSTADCAAIRMLKTYPSIKNVYLCLDHDSAGIEGAYRVAENIHDLGDYSVWRKMPKNKDWDEDLKELYGKPAIPSSEHRKLQLFRQICSDCLTDECLQSGTWKHIADAKGYVLINLFSLLHSEMKKAESSLDIQTEQKHLKIMAVGCLAFCCCREKQMGKTFSFDRYTDAVRSAYKPHRDTGNSEEQREVLQKKIASLEKEFGKSISLSFTEMKRQIDAVISLAVECLMLCATVECEQLEQLEQLEQGLALGLE